MKKRFLDKARFGAAAALIITGPALIFKMPWLLWLAVLSAGCGFLLIMAPRAEGSESGGLPAVATTRPTARASGLFALSVPAALLVMVADPAVWYLALYLPLGVLTFILADLLICLPKRHLAVEPTLPGRLHVGQIAEVEVLLKAAGYQRPTPLEALMELGGEVEPPQTVRSVLKPEGLKLILPILPGRRGQVQAEALWLRWKGPLGLIEKKVRLSLNSSIDVIPDVRGVHEAALQFFARDAIYGVKAQNFKGEGTEFENLCDYAQGMDSRFIDWKHSARHRKLLCKEFRQERNHQVILGFDTGHLMLEPINGLSKLDHAIKAGLLLSWISLYHGDLVGGCGFDGRFRNYLRPGRGMTHFSQFQRFTASLEYRTEETNFTLGLAELNSRLSRRALVVLFTEFIDTISAELLLESLQLMTRRHVVIFVTTKDPMLTRLQNANPAEPQAGHYAGEAADISRRLGRIEAGSPPSFFTKTAEAVIADGFLRERAIVLERVARMGIHCLSVPAESISAALLNRYLLIKQRGLL